LNDILTSRLMVAIFGSTEPLTLWYYKLKTRCPFY
jgi:predicted membrane-bound mannosyltransferase